MVHSLPKISTNVWPGYAVLAGVFGVAILGVLIAIFMYHFVRGRRSQNAYNHNRTSSMDGSDYGDYPRSSFCSITMSEMPAVMSPVESPTKQCCTLPPAAVLLSVSKVQPPHERRQTLPAISLTPPKGAYDDTDYTKVPLVTTTNYDKNSEGQDRLSLGFLETAKRRFSATIGFPTVPVPEDERQRSSSVCSERFSILEGRSNDSSFNRLDSTDNGDMGLLALNLYGAGRLCFSLSYNREIGILYITVHKAAHLLGRQKPKETNSFFVKISLFTNDPDGNAQKQVYTTSVVAATHNPIFEQNLSMPLAWNVVEGSSVKFSVKQTFKEERSRSLGKVLFRLMQSYLGEQGENSGSCLLQDIWRDLDDSKLPLRQSALSAIPSQIRVSLSYDSNHQCINVGVIKGRNLINEEFDKSVYVRVSLMASERVLLTRKTHAIKVDLVNPNFNETFQMPIASHLMGTVCLVLFVCGLNADKYSHRIGQLIIGPVTYTDGSGLSQWNQMVANPEVETDFWHTI